MNEQHKSDTQPDHFTQSQPTTNNLDVLATLHLVYGILSFLGSLFFAIYIFMGAVLGDNMMQNTPNPPPFDVSWVFIIIGSVGIFFCVLKGIFNFLTYSYLRKAKNFNFTFATAIINCLTGVLGIVLGVFTLVEINKPHVKELFYKKKS